ncbi:uncharacterized protein EI97DRAFT_428459 [Westerdykella ornata]|uniref:RAD52 homolog n=1 Tax=Westerdykella ornata TaxID=318751 RepID=A0A6A6J5A9_WESOR|nr:uncharacterized protein EI97DRAFT_428459 [Westerdykella ornata]KAF2271323.1 hypothetical protein EI97DRAFT_428459 [Westerdykella ornata]
MPAPGDQYASPHIKNPFDERSVSAFTAAEIATLQSRLDKQLGPEYVSHRSGAGGSKVAYLEGTKAIALANDVFGFNGWSSSLQQVQIDYVDESPNGRVNLGLSIVVRVTLRDGTYHEDIGYGTIENCKGKGAAFEKAKKEAATDGLKRALRNFGNVLGNCLYDKEYLKKIGSMKVKPTKFDESKLHRHPDFRPPPQVKEECAAVKKEENAMVSVGQDGVSRTAAQRTPTGESMDFDDEFGGNDFDGVEFSEHGGDEFTLDSLSVPEDGPGKAPEVSIGLVQNSGPLQRPGVAINNGTAQQPTRRMPSIPSGNAANGTSQPRRQEQQRNQGLPRSGAQAPQTPVRPEAQRPHGPGATVDIHAAPNAAAQQAQQRQPFNPTPPQAQQNSNNSKQPPAPHQQQQQQQQPAHPRPPQQEEQGHPFAIPAAAQVGFLHPKAAERLRDVDPSGPLPPEVKVFNPHAESPQLEAKRTPGIDRSRSMKIKREQVGLPPANLPGQQGQQGGIGVGLGMRNSNVAGGVHGGGGGQPFRPLTTAATTTTVNNARPHPNFVNPNTDPNRRIGVPGGGHAMSPLANRGAYKSPVIHGQGGNGAATAGGGGGGGGVKRPPLADVSTHYSNGGNGGNGGIGDGGAEGGMEPNKRPRLDGGGMGGKALDRENVAPGDAS